MLKIISGKFKGRKLNNIKVDSIRPTSALVKKSIMDSIMFFENKNILDLCCGVGTLGIEAISRGAQSVDFVDNSRNSKNIFLAAFLWKLKSLLPKYLGGFDIKLFSTKTILKKN